MDNHEPFLPFVRTRLPANSAQSFRESLFCFKKSPQQYCNNEARFGRTYKLGSGSERTTNSCLSSNNKAHMQCLAKAKKRVATLSRRGKNSTALRSVKKYQRTRERTSLRERTIGGKAAIPLCCSMSWIFPPFSQSPSSISGLRKESEGLKPRSSPLLPVICLDTLQSASKGPNRMPFSPLRTH